MRKNQSPKGKEVIEIPAKSRHEILNIPKQKLRVCAYCRVSTDLEAQESSYESQLQFYTKYISDNPNWVFSGIYADKGISGKSAKNRPQFMQMIQDCEQGKIDLIITKSISRFARNTQNSIYYIRLLRDMGIPILFEQQCLNSMDHNVDLILAILSSIAEEESRSMSQNIKSAFRHRAAMGIITQVRQCYGYRIGKDGSFVITPQQAHIVMRIFNEYEQGDCLHTIANRLTIEGIPSPAGKPNWHVSSIRAILCNEKYVGDCLLQKTYSSDFLMPRKRNEGETTSWLLKDNHEAIITREQFDHVQVLLAERKIPPKNKTSYEFPLSTLITCKKCGRNYHRVCAYKTGSKDIMWKCFNRYKTKTCDNRNVSEKEVFTAYRQLFPNRQIRFLRKHIARIYVDGDSLTFITIDGEEKVFSLKPRGGYKKPPTKK